jgi:bifunctional DNase/RNase
MAVEMELVGIELERPPNIPCLVLRETGGARRLLPIFIGPPEATAIALALDNVEVKRPMTHDLMKTMLDELGATIDRIVVTDLRDNTFFAEIVMTIAGGEVRSISSRPSDAVALAVRVGTPIFASEAVLDEAGRDATDGDEVPEEVVEQFRAFIDQVNPDDFAS